VPNAVDKKTGSPVNSVRNAAPKVFTYAVFVDSVLQFLSKPLDVE
jgi:hypothetical protein